MAAQWLPSAARLEEEPGAALASPIHISIRPAGWGRIISVESIMSLISRLNIAIHQSNPEIHEDG